MACCFLLRRGAFLTTSFLTTSTFSSTFSSSTFSSSSSTFSLTSSFSSSTSSSTSFILNSSTSCPFINLFNRFNTSFLSINLSFVLSTIKDSGSCNSLSENTSSTTWGFLHIFTIMDSCFFATGLYSICLISNLCSIIIIYILL